jgi:hypothetical protein
MLFTPRRATCKAFAGPALTTNRRDFPESGAIFADFGGKRRPGPNQ